MLPPVVGADALIGPWTTIWYRHTGMHNDPRLP